MELTFEGRMAHQRAVQARLRATVPRAPTDIEAVAAGLRGQFEASTAALTARAEKAEERLADALAEENRLLRCLRVLRADVTRNATPAELVRQIVRALSGERL